MNPARRQVLKAGGALIVGFALPGHALSQSRSELSADALDAFFAIRQDGSVTLYCGKVDLGQGIRIAIPQMAAEELGIPVERISFVDGDTALTPDQGPTAGSTGIMRAGVQIRQAAATARQALLGLAAAKLNVPAGDLEIADGVVRAKAGGPGIACGELIGERQFSLKVDPKAPLKDPAKYTVVGKPLPRPDVAAKATGRHKFVHDIKLPGMLHGRVVRPASVGAKVVAIDESGLKAIPGARVVRINDFVGVVAPDEWDCLRALRALKVQWSGAAQLMGADRVVDFLKSGPFLAEDAIVNKGDATAALASAPAKVSGTFYWPMQTHGSIGPSCAVADVRDGAVEVWSASQATHRFRQTCARMLGVSPDKVRVRYADGAGCYGMNGHDDAAAEAVLLSRALGKPVRVQWMRAEEHGWDPKGPPQLISIDAALGADGRIGAWRAEMWLPRATAKLPSMPLVSVDAAGIAQPQGITTGLISQNGEPPYACANQSVQVHWLKDSPLRPSNIRAPGKVANLWAVESMVDALAYEAKADPVEFRLRGLTDPRGIEVLKRAAALIGWQPHAQPAGNGTGRGIAYCHYKHNETYVAMAMEVAVDRSSGAVRVKRVACAHDCGLVVNPDGVRAQVEGNILQTLSRTLHEEVAFDRERVTSVDWASYPVLRFSEVPELAIELIDRPAQPPLGAGEAASAPVPAALANAIYDATGVRLTRVPFTPARVLGRA